MQILLQTQEPAPGTLSHCKQIHSIDALRRSQCSLEIAYDQLRSKQIGKTLEFVRAHTTDDARVYQVWMVTAFLLHPHNEHVMLVRLVPLRDVTVHVLTLGTTTNQRITKAMVHRAGNIRLPSSEITINEQDAAEYFQMDQELERAEMGCRAGHTKQVLEFLRDAASKYEAQRSTRNAYS
jgi:hypothetical protein